MMKWWKWWNIIERGNIVFNPSTVPQIRDKIIFVLGVCTLARSSELCSLKVEDLDIVDDGVYVKIMRKKSRGLPFCAEDLGQQDLLRVGFAWKPEELLTVYSFRRFPLENCGSESQGCGDSCACSHDSGWNGRENGSFDPFAWREAVPQSYPQTDWSYSPRHHGQNRGADNDYG